MKVKCESCHGTGIWEVSDCCFTGYKNRGITKPIKIDCDECGKLCLYGIQCTDCNGTGVTIIKDKNISRLKAVIESFCSRKN